MPVQLPTRNQPVAKEMIPNAGLAGAALIERMPLPLVLLLAAPYRAGRNGAEAIKLAHQLYAKEQFTATLDILGEDSHTDEQCLSAVAQYRNLIDAVYAAPLLVKHAREQMSISFKPSMFSTVTPKPGAGSNRHLDEAYQRIKSVVDYAATRQVRLTLEAEDHNWTDFHLDTYFSLLKEGYSNLGTVIQARLFRSKDDIRRFDENSRVRLLIGIYNEPADIAYTQKPQMKEVLVDLARELLARGTYVELASHDTGCVDKFLREAVLPTKAPVTQFETQFLLGVPRTKAQRALTSGSYFHSWLTTMQGDDIDQAIQLQHNGVLVRLYLPFGSDDMAGPYCRRRLKANPNMIGYGIKNLLHIE